MTNKKAAIFHYPSAEAALRTSRTSDRQPQRRTSQWTVNTLQTKQTAMTGASVGTMRTNMTMRCRAFDKKNRRVFWEKMDFFFWGGRVFCWGKIKKQSNLRTLHCGRDDSCRSVFFFSVFFFKVAKWIFVWVLFSPPPFFNAKFPFALKKNPWRMSWLVEEKPGKPHVGPQTRSRSQFTSLAEAGTNFERLGGFGVFKVRGCS